MRPGSPLFRLVKFSWQWTLRIKVKYERQVVYMGGKQTLYCDWLKYKKKETFGVWEGEGGGAKGKLKTKRTEKGGENKETNDEQKEPTTKKVVGKIKTLHVFDVSLLALLPLWKKPNRLNAKCVSSFVHRLGIDFRFVVVVVVVNGGADSRS